MNKKNSRKRGGLPGVVGIGNTGFVKKAVQERITQKPYVLTVLDNGVYRTLKPEEQDEFEKTHPDIAKYFDDPAALQELQLPEFPESAPVFESWDKAARRLLNTLWKMNQAYIFHEPVDPVKLEIHDYHDIVKQPMDFGTVKQNLSSNKYDNLQQFLDDIKLTIRNCFLYNGENSQVWRMCKHVQDEFLKQYEQLNMNFYLPDGQFDGAAMAPMGKDEEEEEEEEEDDGGEQAAENGGDGG